MTEIAVSAVVFDPEIYPRYEWSQATVDRYTEALAAGVVFPPIVLETGTNRLFDGYHRLCAHKAAGQETIAAEWTEIPDGLPAKAFTTSLGTGHGSPIRMANLRDNARDIAEQNPDFSLNTLATLWGISRQTVARWVGNLHEQSRQLRAAKVLLLARAGWTQKQIAGFVGVDQSTVSRMQNVTGGHSAYGLVGVLRQAAMALPISSDVADALFDEIEQARAETAERQVAESGPADVPDVPAPQPDTAVNGSTVGGGGDVAGTLPPAPASPVVEGGGVAAGPPVVGSPSPGGDTPAPAAPDLMAPLAQSLGVDLPSPGGGGDTHTPAGENVDPAPGRSSPLVDAVAQAISDVAAGVDPSGAVAKRVWTPGDQAVVASARRSAATLANEVRGHVQVLRRAAQLGEHLVTRELVCELREAADELERQLEGGLA